MRNSCFYAMKRIIFFSSLILLLFVSLFLYQYIHFNDHRLHVIFCEVGQGDGIFLRTPSGKTILVDGGPGKDIEDCLAGHMPFWQRVIDLMILSHPHADHLNGLNRVLKSYTVRHFVTEPLGNKTMGYKNLIETVKAERVDTHDVLAGEVIRMGDGVVLHILGPTKAYLERTSPKGIIGESAEFGSIIQVISYGNFDVLLDGDSQVEGMKQATQGLALRKQIELLQVPHHGSRFGLDEKILSQLSPKLSVISVGKNNYGHPSSKTLQLLQQAKVPFMRTDQDGDVEIVSDGRNWWIAK